MQPVLPTKYYLTHACELFNHLQQNCDHLLNQDHRDYLQAFENLTDDAQCLLIRLLTRKHAFIKRNSLQYPEINNIERAEAELTERGLISSAMLHDWSSLAPLMTKAELLSVLRAQQISLKSSLPKGEILAMAEQCQPFPKQIWKRQVQPHYIAKRKMPVVDYLFFLYFGDLRNRFQKFAMRDLGVLKTRATSAQTAARFDDKRVALTTFDIQCFRRDFKQQPQAVFEQAGQYILDQKANVVGVENARDKLIIELGDFAVGQSVEHAMTLWQHSLHPSAVERWVRQGYKHHGKEKFENAIGEMRERDDLAAESRVFLEDFYMRKYHGKRTSVYTDTLRNAGTQLSLDEAYINDVEEGVITHYQAQGVEAHFSENKLWRVLFAFTFWELFYEHKQHNEFDRLPAPLLQPNFYTDQRQAIEQCLAIYSDREQCLRRFTAIAAQNYGFPTGLFRWRSNLMDLVKPCVTNAPVGAIEQVLRKMAKHYQSAKDGYPDLMIVEQGQLKFEEVKAPGDVLRPNQLVSIQRMRDAGFKVDVSQVQWQTNPDQIYAVVDIETTGGKRSGNAITEIAVVQVKGGEIIDQWSTLVNPQRPIPYHITQLTGIDNDMVRDAPLFAEIADTLKDKLSSCIFVAHNVGFDYGFIKAAYESIGRGFRMPKYCTVQNSRKAFPGLQSYSLGKLTKALDIDLDNHHRALADATATAHLLRLIQQQNSDAG